jgi:hypothetical protein
MFYDLLWTLSVSLYIASARLSRSQNRRYSGNNDKNVGGDDVWEINNRLQISDGFRPLL